jgi:hypothetical protein
MRESSPELKEVLRSPSPCYSMKGIRHGESLAYPQLEGRQLEPSAARRNEMTPKENPANKPLARSFSEAFLDNPIWYSLTTCHSHIAMGGYR